MSNKRVEMTISALSASPVVRAAENLLWWGRHGDDQLAGLFTELRQQANQVASGDLSRGLEALTAHAHLLDAMFQRLAAQAAAKFDAGRPRSGQDLMRLALQAQDQARLAWDSAARLRQGGLNGSP
ncbi:MAG: hypothetical protein LKM32_09270 [Chiayiivirga sp.]|jgi:hypothetical protein|uniref:hypothetical protein n=1 Tax=Chiayiivirga sp. TaxID=2041042 RepID=UPI0025C4884A|nr:hypothetical protein [Chiayiivirga sp.]MCI1711868.1 hypothetical protein [Chiayiivirga sp.]MCI1729544.1 hypothetical protein [Chiayiivirga sp.]